MNIVKLKDLCLLVVDCPHSTPRWTDSGVIVLRNQYIKNGKLDLTSPSFTDEENYNFRTKRAIPQEGDIVITREAPMGEVCMIPADLKCCLGQRMVLLRPDPIKCDSNYLLFALQSKTVQEQISWNEGTGSVVSNLRIPVLESLEIPWVGLNVQKNIGRILKNIDDKIELNNQMNETLEAMARAIFKEWFIDFGPVRAKAEGRRPFGMDDETAALFPDSFEESELGMIPKGWRVSRYIDNIEVIGGGTPRTSVDEFWNGNIPWFSVVDSPKDGDVWIIDTAKKITNLGLNSSRTKLLEVGTVILTARGTVGKLGLVGKPMAMNQSCYALKPKDSNFIFYYYLIYSLVNQLKGKSHGSVFDTITTNTIESLFYISPPPNLINKYHFFLQNHFEIIKNNLFENKTLTEFRDLLLPRLISGEIKL